MSETATYEKFKCRILEDGIIENTILEGQNIEVKDVLKIKERNLQLANEKPYALLIISENYSTISKEAMELSASSSFKQITVAKALLVSSLPHRLICNFYIRVNKPAIPTKIFKDTNEAMNWLRMMLLKNSSVN